ncbi:RagB/SusD family nutrient uptake outer membrane protein [Dyadobacter sp. CY347]|uniref:RagB/SusD family nutrient uptake outer membrane protein n=1 Tax=Dyadobacter sp. CY347 TaxID=2909336 RepID=UPI001F2ECC1E|nr:RagB/SusD family nutrient uptake outer membrane protein [Dyadobacter sp. CY347]MCF2491640.1 RagB/SusD family nutrient uptake outer membrane protein [Dyadobacter sp. CY347]
MKARNNFFIHILLLLTLPLSWSCKDSFFEASSQDGSINESSAFKSKKDFNSAVTSMYASIQGSAAAGERWITIPGYISQDVVDVSVNPKPLVSFMTDANQDFQIIWTELYKVVSSSNIVLSKLATIEDGVLTDAEKKSFTAQANFFRGFAYLSLARAFGDVPMLLESYSSSQNSLPCTPKAQVFAQAIKDISESMENLPEANDYAAVDKGRVSKGAALSYLAYAYMYAEDWAKAKTSFESLFALTNPKYSLATSPRTPFSILKKNMPEYLAENIFEVQFRDSKDWTAWGPDIITNSEGSFLAVLSAARNIGGDFDPWGGWGEYVVNKKALDSYEPNDLRRKIMVIGHGDTYQGENMTRPVGPTDWAKCPQTNAGFSTKYWLGLYNNDLSPQNLPQMRFAEVLLNYAEILFKLNNPASAYEYINKVRRRASLADLPVSNNADVFMQNLMDERRHELLFEPNLWFHYTRTGTAAKFLLDKHGITMQPNWINFPIPAREKSINPNLCSNGY